jgi:hypothetical protein
MNQVFKEIFWELGQFNFSDWVGVGIGIGVVGLCIYSAVLSKTIKKQKRCQNHD